MRYVFKFLITWLVVPICISIMTALFYTGYLFAYIVAVVWTLKHNPAWTLDQNMWEEKTLRAHLSWFNGEVKDFLPWNLGKPIRTKTENK